MSRLLSITLCMLFCILSVPAEKIPPPPFLHLNPHSGAASVCAPRTGYETLPLKSRTSNLPTSNLKPNGLIGGGDFPGGFIGGGELPPGLSDISQEYHLTVSLVYDESLYTAVSINYIGGDGLFKTNGRILDPGAKSVDIELTEGVYDFLVTFQAWDTSGNFPPQSMLDGYAPAYHVMKENVNVNKDTELAFDMAEARNFIEFHPVNHNGEEFKVGVLRFIDEAPGYEWDDSDANVWDVNFYNTFYNTVENETIYGFRSNYGHRTEDGRGGALCGNYYINDISDKYVLYQNIVAYDGDANSMWTINLATRGNGTKTVANTSDNFKSFSQNLVVSEAFGKYEYESRFGTEAQISVGGTPLVTYNFFFDGMETPVCHMAEHNEVGDDFNTSTTSFPCSFELAKFVEENSEWLKAGIKGCGVILENNALLYSNPFDNYFNGPISNSLDMGANTPAIFAPITPVDGGLTRPIMYIEPRFIGQFGEERDIDLLETDLEIYHNDNLKCNSMADLYKWAEEFAADNHTDGTVKFRFTDHNIMMDDIKAVNVTEITYTEGLEDVCPPVLQFVRFKQSFPEKIGTKLSNQFSKIEFIAGDMNSNGYDTDYLPAEVNVEYAPHGSNEFTHLENTHLAQVNENRTERLPVYITVLTDMNRKSPDGWFDFRFTISDDAGNKTVETLSPAVYIESLHEKSSIDNTFSSASRNDSETEYFDMTGRRVYTPAPGSLLIEKRGSDAALRIIK